jgi:hypothetical protein
LRISRQILLLTALLAVLAFAPGCGGDDPTGPGGGRGTILVLGDGGTEDHVKATLDAAGFTVRDGGLFHEFTGDALNGVDAVVLLAGIDYNHDMIDAGEVALKNFVRSGGGLLTTEWLAYNAKRRGYNQVLDPILPVSYAGSYASGSETYTVMEDHPVTAGLPATFDTGEDSQYAVVGPRSGALQLIRGDRSGHAVVTWRRGGRIVSWNMTGEYGGSDVWNAHMNRLLVNAAGFVAGEGDDPPSTTQFELATGFMNVTHDGDSGSEGDFYITMEIFDHSAGPDGVVVDQEKVLVQVESGRVVSPGIVVAGDVPEIEGRRVSIHVSIYENDPGGPQAARGIEHLYAYNSKRDCWVKSNQSWCTETVNDVLKLRNEPGETALHTDLNWSLTIDPYGK